jgi:hypothetical protein
MTKKSMKEMLSNSVKSEQDTINDKLGNFNDKVDKFEKAEKFFKEDVPKKITVDTVVKDLFSFPKYDYQIIGDSIDRALDSKININKSEIVRAALNVLQDLNDSDFKDAISKVEKIKRGRK